MGRFQSLIFTAAEFDQLLRQVEKLLDHRNKTQAREVRRKEDEYKILMSLKRKLHGPDIELKFDRKDLRGIQSLCKLATGLLQNSIIPGYQDRISKAVDAEDKANLQGYADRSLEAFKVYTQILSKVEKVL